MTARKQKDAEGYKYARIKTDLSIQILGGALRPHDRIPSLNEITQKYKVSKITARRALNDLMNEGLVYASKGRGAFVAEPMQKPRRSPASRDNQLGVVFAHGAGQFMSDIITGIDEEAFDRGVQINLCLSADSYAREAENLLRLVEQGLDKIILFMVLDARPGALNPNVPLYLRLQEQGISLLLLACDVAGVPIPSVVYDDADAFRRLVAHFHAQKRRHLAYATRIDNASTTFERFRGFKDGMLESGLPWIPARHVEIRAPSHDSIVTASTEAFVRWLDGAGDVDAVLCSDEMVAAGLFEALEQAGVPAARRPQVGGMGSSRNLHVLRGNPYVLLEDNTHLLGSEAARLVLEGELARGPGADGRPLRHVIRVPLRPPGASEGRRRRRP
jgi:GntR family transcriptional regulator of arabinose operon